MPSAVSALLCIFVCRVQAQQLQFHGNPPTDAGLTLEMARLARSAIPAYKEQDRAKYLDNLLRLQIAAGEYRGATASIFTVQSAISSENADRLAPFRLLAQAKSNAKELGTGFDDAFRQLFRDWAGKLDDKSALRHFYWFVANVDSAGNEFRRTLDRQKDKTEISLEDAIALIRQYTFWEVYRELQPLTVDLIAEDNKRRYLIQDDILIRVSDGTSISAIAVRPRKAAGRLPAAFTFTIYAANSVPDNAMRAAASGYVGVVGFTRGKRFSPDKPVPYEHDGADAREVIDWIVKQPWSDGRVGMFGGSYDGFTCWAIAKQVHPALRTIVPYVAAIPGLGLPMENNVFLNANYGWAFYVTDNKTLDESVYADPTRWSSLNDKWYSSGRPYRDFDRVDGTPNQWFQRWLSHPAFDRYWQAMVPYQRDFSKITIPVLTITGYYDDGQISALHYLSEHYKYNSRAEHYLLIGPWDHFGSQAGTKPAVLRGYVADPAAQVDTPDITFQWLDYILRGGKKPELLKDKINYEEMGADTWRHSPTLEAMHSEVLTLYLTSQKDGKYYRLARERPPRPAFLEQTLDFADRKSESNDYYPAPIVGKHLDLSTGFAFVSEPFESPTSVNGIFAGVLKSQINKKDMDFGVVLYELMPDDRLFHLSYFLGRASFARDMSMRHLLTPGRMETIPFNRTRMVSRQLTKGSRLLLVLNVNKNRYSQLNYGTGKDTSDESIADAKEPLHVKWRNDSYVQIPMTKQR